jgi:aspartate aminotransferase
VLALADNIDRLGTESAFAVLARAQQLERQGANIVHLEIGQPDFPTPEHVVQAAIASMCSGETGYCATEGIPELRSAAAQYLGASRGLTIEPDEVLVAPGAKPFLFFTVLACVNPGDEVIYPDPSFPIYESAIAWAGGVPVPLALQEERGFSFDPDQLERLISPRTRLVILNSPHNPTGAVIPEADLRALADLLANTDAWVLSDEVYSKIVYGEPAPSVAALPGMRERTVLLDGCSKTFAMTGWRCGFAAVPEPLRDALTRFLVNSVSCVPPFVQRAAVAALTGPMVSVEAMVAEFERRRDLLISGLNTLPGVRCNPPSGAFYAFANVTGTGIDADVLAHRLLEDAGVAVLSGSSFGARGRDFIRISYAASQDRLTEGLRRIGGELSPG